MPQYLVNLSKKELVDYALKMEFDTKLSKRGALCVNSYIKKGRSPSDKRIVDTPDIHADVDWGKVNIAMTEESFVKLRTRALAFLERQPTLFVINAFAGHDPLYRLKIRIISTRPYHALFIQNMLIEPTKEELANFGEPDFTIYNAGECFADRTVKGVSSETCVALNFKTKEQVILGTQYAGEMKKGVLTIMMYVEPKRGHLTMHASANEGKDGDVTVFFGLSGTGKTTLSADPHRALIGDDEHVWTRTGVYNVEGGCYAKAIGLAEETEPDIYRAVRFGAVAENIVLKRDGEIDFNDITQTENTRVAYPLNYIDGAKLPAIAGHPKNLVFLTNDAYGVMPPVSLLTPGQAKFWFVTGYTAKVGGTEVGITEPQPTFSACFGAPFLVLHPTAYGEMLAKLMEEHHAKVWLVNTGWSGGKYGTGKRMKLTITRAIIDGIHDGSIEKGEFHVMPGWGLRIPKSVKNVPPQVLDPIEAWKDKDSFVRTIDHLASLFRQNFKTYSAKASPDMLAAAPQDYRGSKL